MKRLTTLLASLVLAFVVVPSTAQAHWPSVTGTAAWAHNVVYNDWNHWCGHGTTWFCDDRMSYRHESRTGAHSIMTYYCWANRSYYGAWKQWCVVVRVEHGRAAELVRNRYVNAQS